MNRLFVTFCLALPLLFVVDTAHAGLFGRRWERRRAELQGHVTQQVAGAAAGVEKKLGESLDAKVAEESAKLEQQLAAIRQQAADAVAAEAKKLQAETAASIAKLREEATAIVAAEAKKMREEIAADLAKVRDDNSKQVAEALAKLDKAQAASQEEVKQAVADAQKLKEQLMPELTALVKAEVKAGIAAVTNASTTVPAAPAEERPESKQGQPRPQARIEKQDGDEE
jgi:hypothetical protein